MNNMVYKKNRLMPRRGMERWDTIGTVDQNFSCPKKKVSPLRFLLCWRTFSVWWITDVPIQTGTNLQKIVSRIAPTGNRSRDLLVQFTEVVFGSLLLKYKKGYLQVHTMLNCSFRLRCRHGKNPCYFFLLFSNSQVADVRLNVKHEYYVLDV